ncbi:putative thioredoxin-like protein [Rosa chinensis]|uniref:Putative thioredoxin-like protein n=1 Tax=Rosa chinensis TaxID=74649 RepID=A0A2P6S9N3_ROSCH|nr:uncharacterized protein At5g39865 [Rosa chinensis]PRQ55366.1 putative thioredoxin-like protein [Rosa chinensis]
MADLENRVDLSSKAKSKTSSPNRGLFFNRSMTMYAEPKKAQHALDHAGSFKKFYNSMETVRSASSSFKGKVKKLCSFFETDKLPTRNVSDESQSLVKLRPSKSMANSKSLAPDFRVLSIRLPGTDDRIVMYLTSLRGIRRTYEDCYAVKMIFRGFGVWVDERDISMDSDYRKELQSVLGAKNVSLPQVFIRGKYVGGAEVIKQLFETGELAKILQGLPIRKPGSVCGGCGDARFVPCLNCSGSRKVFDEDEETLKRCIECNENGLIRCPNCCS